MTRNFSKLAKQGSAFLAVLGLSFGVSAMQEGQNQSQTQEQITQQQICEKTSQNEVCWPEPFYRKIPMTKSIRYKGGIKQFSNSNSIIIETELKAKHSEKNDAIWSYGKEGEIEGLDEKVVLDMPCQNWVEVEQKDCNNDQNQQQLVLAKSSNKVMKSDVNSKDTCLGKGAFEKNELRQNKKNAIEYHCITVEEAGWGDEGLERLSEEEARQVFKGVYGKALREYGSTNFITGKGSGKSRKHEQK